MSGLICQSSGGRDSHGSSDCSTCNSSNVAYRQHGFATQRAGAFLEFLAKQIGFPKVQQVSLPLRRGSQYGRAAGVVQNHRALRRTQRGKLNRTLLATDEYQEPLAILEEIWMLDCGVPLSARDWRCGAALGGNAAYHAAGKG